MRIDGHERPSRGVRLLAAVLLLITAVGSAALSPLGEATAAEAEEPAQPREWRWPLALVPPVVRGFDAPTAVWDAAHRGVDLAGSTAQQVHSIGSGTVSFAGVVAGRGVVVVDHGELRSTYEPVTALLRPGAAVVAGQVIGLLQAVGSHCSPDTCLHLGVRRGDEYLDPLTLLGSRTVRLKPLDGLLPPGLGAGLPPLL